MIEPTKKQIYLMAISKFLIDSGQEHAINAFTEKCINELCIKCKIEDRKNIDRN